VNTDDVKTSCVSFRRTSITYFYQYCNNSEMFLRQNVSKIVQIQGNASKYRHKQVVA